MRTLSAPPIFALQKKGGTDGSVECRRGGQQRLHQIKNKFYF